MARPPQHRSDFEPSAQRVDSTIRPPPPRANSEDLELEDDAATTVLPLRWPEPPKDLGERLQGVRTDGVGLSRSVAASARPRRTWLWRSLGVAVIVGAMLRLVPLRTIRFAAKTPAAPRPEPAAVVLRAATTPPAPPATPPPAAVPAVAAAPPLAVKLEVRPSKPPIDVTSLPKAPPIAAPIRTPPKRVVKPVVRSPAPTPEPTQEPAPETGAHIDENAYDAPPKPKCRTCEKADNPY